MVTLEKADNMERAPAGLAASSKAAEDEGLRAFILDVSPRDPEPGSGGRRLGTHLVEDGADRPRLAVFGARLVVVFEVDTHSPLPA